MNYGKLKEVIRNKCGNQRKFAKVLNMSYTALNLRLNGKAEWKSDEMVTACELLDIPIDKLHLYFFDKKV